jgi:hypothetical protein
MPSACITIVGAKVKEGQTKAWVAVDSLQSRVDGLENHSS